MRERLIAGKLLRPRGLKGEIAVHPLGGVPERFYQITSCYLENHDGSRVIEASIRHVSISGDRVFLLIDGCEDREAAAKLSGYYLSVPRSEALPLDEFSWYISDLIGLPVEDEERGSLGVVEEVIQNNAQDLLRIRQSGAADLYFPMLRKDIVLIDTGLGIIRVRLPEGLFELYRPSQS